MKKPPRLLSILLLLSFATGCSSVKRYKSATWMEEDNTLVNMELFGATLEQTASVAPERNLWDLSAGAQTQLIQILNDRYPLNDEFINALSKQYLADGASPVADFTRKDLKMVFTISKQRDYRLINEPSGRFSPADRIEYLKFSLEIPPEYKLRFTKWNRFTTEYGEVEIADVSFSTSLDLEADGSILESDAGGKSTFNRSERQEVKTRYLKLNGSINEHLITVEEEGNREIDLTGNIVADVSLAFEAFPERIALPGYDGKIPGSGKADLAGFRFSTILVPRLMEVPDTLYAMLTLDYVYRHVQSGSKTFAEWDDRVEYYTGVVKKPIPLFYKRDYLPVLYCIGSENEQVERLKIREWDGKEYLLQFPTYLDASRVLEYISGLEEAVANDPVKVGNTPLLFKGQDLTWKDAAAGKWKVVPVFH